MYKTQTYINLEKSIVKKLFYAQYLRLCFSKSSSSERQNDGEKKTEKERLHLLVHSSNGHYVRRQELSWGLLHGQQEFKFLGHLLFILQEHDHRTGLEAGHLVIELVLPFGKLAPKAAA